MEKIQPLPHKAPWYWLISCSGSIPIQFPCSWTCDSDKPCYMVAFQSVKWPGISLTYSVSWLNLQHTLPDQAIWVQEMAALTIVSCILFAQLYIGQVVAQYPSVWENNDIISYFCARWFHQGNAICPFCEFQCWCHIKLWSRTIFFTCMEVFNHTSSQAPMLRAKIIFSDSVGPQSLMPWFNCRIATGSCIYCVA